MTETLMWKQITIPFDSYAKLNELAWPTVQRVESVAQSDMLYFARYSSPSAFSLVVKVLTARSCGYLKRALGLSHNDVIAMTEPGSAAHALGYRIIKAAKAQKEPERLTHDVVHWMLNMAGFSYTTEVLEYLKMAYSGVQNHRTAIGELKPSTGSEPVKDAVRYTGKCRKCRAVVVGLQPGRVPCPTLPKSKKACSGFAVLAYVKS